MSTDRDAFEVELMMADFVLTLCTSIYISYGFIKCLREYQNHNKRLKIAWRGIFIVVYNIAALV